MGRSWRPDEEPRLTPRERRALSTLAFLSVLLTAGLLLAGCPRPMPPDAGPPSAGVADDAGAPPLCAAPIMPPRPEDVCDGLFSSDGYACVRCAGTKAACYDGEDKVLCVPRCIDKACRRPTE